MKIDKNGKNGDHDGILLTRSREMVLLVSTVLLILRVHIFFRIPLEGIPLDCYQVSSSDSHTDTGHNLESLKRIYYTKERLEKGIVNSVSLGFRVI